MPIDGFVTIGRLFPPSLDSKRMPDLFQSQYAWLVYAYAVSNGVRAVFYIPQLIAVWRSVDGARDISPLTWWMWAANNLLGALFTAIVMNNIWLSLSFWASTLACVATILLAGHKRSTFERARTGDLGAAERSPEAKTFGFPIQGVES